MEKLLAKNLLLGCSLIFACTSLRAEVCVDSGYNFSRNEIAFKIIIPKPLRIVLEVSDIVIKKAMDEPAVAALFSCEVFDVFREVSLETVKSP